MGKNGIYYQIASWTRWANLSAVRQTRFLISYYSESCLLSQLRHQFHQRVVREEAAEEEVKEEVKQQEINKEAEEEEEKEEENDEEEEDEEEEEKEDEEAKKERLRKEQEREEERQRKLAKLRSEAEGIPAEIAIVRQESDVDVQWKIIEKLNQEDQEDKNILKQKALKKESETSIYLISIMVLNPFGLSLLGLTNGILAKT